MREAARDDPSAHRYQCRPAAKTIVHRGDAIGDRPALSVELERVGMLPRREPDIRTESVEISSTISKIEKKVKNYLSLVKFTHTIFAMPFALIGFFLGIFRFRYSEPGWHTTIFPKYFFGCAQTLHIGMPCGEYSSCP